ncbi:MAG TPA: DnaJ domain-containing protein [Sphingomicrobium sp.]|nr:DnaJ domain-containing protein [Sphingomicrobium sp.]
MLSTVASKPNHYERLGLEPDAEDDEIARAFAREMSVLRPHSLADMAQIAIAFKTLRDPNRRRAYDASIAPRTEPELEPEPRSEPAQPAIFPREGWPFIASARIDSAELPSIDSVGRGAAPTAAKPFAASPARQRDGGTAPEAAAHPEGATAHRFEWSSVLEEPLRRDDGRAAWRRTAATMGALFLGVAVVGAGLGVYASRGIDPAQAQNVATVTLPKQSPPAASDPLTATFAEQSREPTSVKPRATAKERRVARAPEPLEPARQRAERLPEAPGRPEAAQTSETAFVSAAMPLPNAVVARTIDGIGYSCGEVASTNKVDGTAGVFKVTCVSGNSFKATPVRGRYHFRQWGR